MVWIAGIPPHIDPAELVVTWRLRTHADMFSGGDGTALEPVSQSDTVTSQQYDQYGQQADETGGDAGCVFTELLSAAELSTTSSAQQVDRPADQQNGLMQCIMPSGLMYPNGVPPANMPFINQNGQLVFLPPAPTNAASIPLLQPPLAGTGNASVSHATATQSAEDAGGIDSDMPAVSSSTEEHPEPLDVSVNAEESGSVAVEPADSSVTESVPDSAPKSGGVVCDGGLNSGRNIESASCLDGIEPVSPADTPPDEPRTDDSVHRLTAVEDQERSVYSSAQPPLTVMSSGVIQQDQSAQFGSQPSMSGQQPYVSHPPMGMMPSDGSSMQGTLVLHNGQLLLVNQNHQAATAAVGSSSMMPAAGGVNALGPAIPQNMAVSGSGAVFVNQFAPQSAQQQPAIAPPAPMPPLGPNQTVMVNTPSGPMALNTVPSQPNQHPSALILPNGQIVPVVTQPNLLFPPQQCTPVTGGLLIPTPSQPVVNLVPPASGSPRMSSFTSTPLPAPVVTVAAGNVPGAGVVRGLVQVPAGQQPGFPGSQPVHVGPGSVIQAVPAQGHLPVQPSSQSAVVTSGMAGSQASIPNLPHTVMATMTPEGTIILTMPQTETQQKAGSKTKKSTVPRPLMPKPTLAPLKTEGLSSAGLAATTTLNFLTPARLPAMVSSTSSIMPVASGGTYMVTNGPNIAGPNISLAPLPTATNNSSVGPLGVSLAPDMVSQKCVEAAKTTDILAKATESIFMLSPSSGDHLSPGVLCLNQSENQLQIDVGQTMEHTVKPNRARSRPKKKPSITMSLPPDGSDEITADHSILDQLEGGDGEDEQSDINDFSDLIRLEPMTPAPAIVVAKETPEEKSSDEIESEENPAVEPLEMVISCSMADVADAPVSEPDMLLQDSDEEVVEIDLTEEPVSPELNVEVEVSEVPVEELEEVTEPVDVSPSEPEPPSSSSKTLFERLEEALMSSSSAASSSPSGATASVNTTQTTNTSMCKSSKIPEKSTSTVVERSKGNESTGADKCAGSTVIDRIGKVLTLEKRSRNADHKNKRLPVTSESINDDMHNMVVDCRTPTTVSTDAFVEQSKSVESTSHVCSSDVSGKSDVAIAVDKSSTEPVSEKRHKRNKKSKEKPSEFTAVEAGPVTETELVEQSDGKRSATDMDEVSADGKHRGFALSNFLPESTKLNESTSAADLLEQSLCMATDDRQKSAKGQSLNTSADEAEEVIISDRTFEPTELPCMMEEATQTTKKELKKDRSKKQSHKTSCNGIAASEMPDTLTFNANELLNIVDVVENMAVETQTEKIRKTHRRKHKTSSVSNGEMEIPSKRKKKSDSSTLKHRNADSSKVGKSRSDSLGLSAREEERHSKHGLHCSRADIVPESDPMDVFNFTSDDIVPLEVVSSYSPCRNPAKKVTDDSSQSKSDAAQLSIASSKTSKLSVGDELNKTSRLSERLTDNQRDVSQAKTVPSEHKENRSSHKKSGHGSDNMDVIQTPPQVDVGNPGDLVLTGNGDRQPSEEVFSKSVTARHSNIATLARHVVPPKMHGSTPRSATKLSAQAVRSRNDPDVVDSVSEVITEPSPKEAANIKPQTQSSSVSESSSAEHENQLQLNSSSSADIRHDESNEPLQVCEASKSINTTTGRKTPVMCTSDASTFAVQTCESDKTATDENFQVVVTSSSGVSSLSHASSVPALTSTASVLPDETPKAHTVSTSSSCAVSHLDSQTYMTNKNLARSCSRDSSGNLVDTGSRTCAKTTAELRDSRSTDYIDRDENVPGRSSSVGSQSESLRRHSADTASYDHGAVDRGYCENYSAGEVTVRSRSSGGSCSVEGRSVSSAQGSLQCDRSVNSAAVNSLNSSSSLRSNCSQKVSTSSNGRNSRSSGASQVGGVYGSGMDCLATTKHRSSCQEDSRQRQMMDSEFFPPRAASSSSCAVQSNLATSVVDPFQYPYAAMTGAQPQQHHHEMSLASIAAAEYGFPRNPFTSFPSPFGFDPQSSVRGPPGRFSPLSHNLPSCGVDKQTHKSAAAGNSIRSSQESSSELSKSRQHQQQVRDNLMSLT